MTRLSLKKADGLIALTEEGARQLEGKATVISHGVVCPGKPVQEDIKSPLTLGIIGRIRPDKGHKDVVDAFLSLKEDFSDWHLLFCGEIRPQHRRFARALIERGKGRIVHQPYNMDREALYAGLSIVVMSSHAEGFSLVVPESMAHGRPLLASRLPHFEVLFKEEVHALAFDTGNSNDLQRQLRRLMGDAPLRNRLSKAAREHAESHLGIAREAKALATLYAAILN